MEKNINETVYVSLEPTNVHHPVVQGFIDGN
jgi:hypothetical protein